MPRHSDITVREAASMIGVNISTVVRWIQAKDLIPTRKLPGFTGSYLIDRAEFKRVARDKGYRIKNGNNG